VKRARDLPRALEEAGFRARRVEGAVAEAGELARRFSVRTMAAPDGVGAQLVATVLNRAANFKAAVTLTVPWHYPAGRIAFSCAPLAGAVDEEWLGDVMARHAAGRARLTRIVAELAGAAADAF